VFWQIGNINSQHIGSSVCQPLRSPGLINYKVGTATLLMLSKKAIQANNNMNRFSWLIHGGLTRGF